MPSFVFRKKLKPGTISWIHFDANYIWYTLDDMMKKKRLNRKTIQKCIDTASKITSRCLIRLPDKKLK
jgi:hypothetical protein